MFLLTSIEHVKVYTILLKKNEEGNAVVDSKIFLLIKFEIIASHLLNLKTFFRRDEVFAQINVQF